MVDDIEATLEKISQGISQNSDIAKAMEEFFKDEIDNKGYLNDIDLRTRLTGRAARGHSTINFLRAIKVQETPEKSSLAEGLHILSISIKRHMLSHQGKSRQEIIDLFKSNAEAKKMSNNFGFMQQMPK